MPRRRDDQLLRALGVRIQSLRLDRGLTQEQLARQVELKPATISRLECGSLNTSLSNLVRIADVLEVTLSELVDLEGVVPERRTPAEEQQLLMVFRELDVERRELAQRLVAELARGS